MLNSKALAASASATRTYVEDVFSTWLYTGNGSTQTITNGIDLAGKGGLVWFKQRDGISGHELVDTARGVNKKLDTRVTNAETSPADLTSFNSNGFSLGYNTGGANFNTGIFASWTFRKAAKFFDVVTYTGNGTARTISHNLGGVPGCIIVKRTDAAADWAVYHRSLGNTDVAFLSQTSAAITSSVYWNNTTPTSAQFTVGTGNLVNASGGTYVAYLFAHDTSTDGLIQCGSYTGSGTSGSFEVNLGWEPQWVMIKAVSTGGVNYDWAIVDNMRGFLAPTTAGQSLQANTTAAEFGQSVASITQKGFTPIGTSGVSNQNGVTYIYIAIRRGPMKTPTDATAVFQPKVYTGTNVDNRLVTTDIVTDLVWARQRNDGTVTGMVVGDRLRGQPLLTTGATAAEVDDADSFDKQLVSAVEYGTAFSSMTGFWVGNDATYGLNFNTTASNHVALAFRRAPGFFDVVAYTGTGVVRTVSHNLGVVPELIIIKSRSASRWFAYHAAIGATNVIVLDDIAASVSGSTVFNNTSPTASVFTLGTNSNVNANTTNYIAYLFASCPGVSKVGSYTGTGTTLNIDCGFTAGARFVLIKRTDSTGDWYVWDTARGIVSGNDPYLLLNSTAAEATATDYIDPLSSGFQISSTAPAAINANGGSFIFLAIA
jgi:hypothetical protein